jgi:2-methylcitrate dehydratase PrpD
MRGVTGPREVFEGNKGFIEAIAGPFEIDWQQEDLESVRHTILKRYNAEIHSQSAIEALLELRAEHGLTGTEVERIELDTFQVAFDIIGGGEEGDSYHVRSKEEADHSLPCLLGVALLDGQVLPEQYLREGITAEDVQQLLRRVDVRPDADLSRRFPTQHSARVTAAPTRRAHARARATRLRGLPHTADGLGRRRGEVRSARRTPGRRLASHKHPRRNRKPRRTSSPAADEPPRESADFRLREARHARRHPDHRRA